MNLNLFPKDLLVELDAAGQPHTTSLAVAQAFSKNHQHVMRDIQKIVNALGEIKISELEAIAENINDVLDDISKLIIVKMDNKEIDDFRKLKAIYDKLKITI